MPMFIIIIIIIIHEFHRDASLERKLQGRFNSVLRALPSSNARVVNIAVLVLIPIVSVIPLDY